MNLLNNMILGFGLDGAYEWVKTQGAYALGIIIIGLVIFCVAKRAWGLPSYDCDCRWTWILPDSGTRNSKKSRIILRWNVRDVINIRRRSCRWKRNQNLLSYIHLEVI